MKKSYYIETYGCQMNEYDSGLVKKILSTGGYAQADSPDLADIVLLNTCAVREKAHERIYGRVEILNSLRKRSPDLVIGILGCMAQSLGRGLLEKKIGVDLVLGPDNYRSLPELIERLGELREEPIERTILSRQETYDEIEPRVLRGCLAYVTIMRGCNNFCSFCVVPYTRGRERSRSPESIVKEIEDLTINGVREVTLLGQNVNSYRSGTASFTDLIRLILDRTVIERLRFTSPHPRDFPEELLALMATEPRFASQIHLPVQSGSTEILKRMKRDYTREEFLELVKRMRTTVPGLGLTTDVIVGFSGETEEQFEATLDLMREARFDMAYMFKYSERENTVASRHYPDDIAEPLKLERLNRLIALQNEISREVNAAEKGRIHRVLVEGTSRRSKTDSMGRTSSGKVVIFPGVVPAGSVVAVEIRDTTSATLMGSLLP